MQSTFAKTNDTHFANLLEYILTCDRFRNMGDFISSLLVEINGWTINLKQLLLFTKFEKSFLTLTRLCPQSMILSNNPALNTISLMASSADKDTIIQYLKIGGPTSTFDQNAAKQLSIKSQLETNPKITFDQLARKPRLINRIAKQLQSRHPTTSDAEDVKDFIKKGRTVLLKEIYTNGYLKQIAPSPYSKQTLSQSEIELQDQNIKTLSKQYKMATGDIHSFLHATYSLLHLESITTRRITSSVPCISYQKSGDLVIMHFDKTRECLNEIGFPVTDFPKIFVNYNWFPGKEDPELLMFIDLCYELLSANRSKESLHNLLANLSEPSTQRDFLLYYDPNIIFNAYQIATELLQVIHLNKFMPNILEHSSLIRYLATDDETYARYSPNFSVSDLSALRELQAILEKLTSPCKNLYKFALTIKAESQRVLQGDKERLIEFNKIHHYICDLKDPDSLVSSLQKMMKITKRLDKITRSLEASTHTETCGIARLTRQ